MKKKNQYSRIYRRQLKEREQGRSSDDWPLAPLTFPDGFKTSSSTASTKKNFNTKSVLKTFEDYLSAVEKDEKKKKKKE